MRSGKIFLGKIRLFWTFGLWMSSILCTSMRKGSYPENNECAINGHLITYAQKGLEKGWPNFWMLSVQTWATWTCNLIMLLQHSFFCCCCCYLQVYSFPHWMFMGSDSSGSSLQCLDPSEPNAWITVVSSLVHKSNNALI